MSKAKTDSARKQMNRIGVLEGRLRLIINRPHTSPKALAEVSALEWAIPILEKYIADNYGELAARIKYHSHEKRNIVNALRLRDGHICYLCGNPMLRNNMTIDHVVPLSKGGRDDITNYRLVHSLCNLQKGNMTVEQYRARKEQAAAQ